MHNMQAPWNAGLQTPEAKQMGMFIHLAQLLNLILFPVGIIVSIVLWQTKKNLSPTIDWHGKMVVNFAISMFIYAIICLILTFVLIGILGFLILAVIGIVFPIIGGIKANNGELWEYPLTIKFLK